MTQLGFLDSSDRPIVQARNERDLALARVQLGADRDWCDRAFAALEAHLRQAETFHADDFWTLGVEEPKERKALGAVILRAARAKLMVKTGEFRPSTSSHCLPKPVWRSLVCGGR